MDKTALFIVGIVLGALLSLLITINHDQRQDSKDNPLLGTYSRTIERVYIDDKLVSYDTNYVLVK